LEFSFDRPKDNFNNKNAEPMPAPSSDPTTIQNERLRKAIERNRARQAAAQPRPQTPPPPPPQSRPQPQQTVRVQEEIHHQPSFLEKPVRETSHVAAEPVKEAGPEMVQETSHTMGPRSTAVVSRRSVAKPDDTEFVPVKRASKKVSSQISYTTSSTRKKSKSIDPAYSNYLVKGAWVFCAIMVLRLIFANGGVTDYYSQKSQLNERLTQLSEIKKDNMQLVREIERMRSDAGYQKKLVRDNLGFIAQDEFLILFPKEN